MTQAATSPTEWPITAAGVTPRSRSTAARPDLHRERQRLHPVCAAELAGAQCLAGAESQLLAEHRIDRVDDRGERGFTFEQLAAHPGPV